MEILINVFWLAICIYYEAGNQSMSGKIAVGHVVMNRVIEQEASVVEVVQKPKQFSFYNMDLRRAIPFIELSVLEESFKAAQLCFEQRMNGDTLKGANHYFNPGLVNPSWAKGMKFITAIEDHTFFKG